MGRFFREKCPIANCQRELQVVRIVGEPLTKPSWLGTVVLCCYHCNLIFMTEAVVDKTSVVGLTQLRRYRTHKVDLNVVASTYADMVSMLDTMCQYCSLAYKQPKLHERSLHFLAAANVYLSNLQQQLEEHIRLIKELLANQKNES